MERDWDVLVVGCGPVGVMTALRCAQRGLRVCAIDRSADLFPHPRAIALHDEAQRLFHRAGLGPLLEKETTPLRGAEFVNANRERVVGFELPDGFVSPLGFAPSVMFEQPTLERALRSHAVRAGVDLRLGVDATGLDLDESGARLTIKQPSGQKTMVSSRWLVGADGASSTIRKLTGIGLDDQGFDQLWLVVDTTQRDPSLTLPVLATQFCDPERVVTFVPGHGARRRWEFQLRDGETAAEMQSHSKLEELLAPWATLAQVQVDRSAVYRFHGLVAQRFRHGPVFLVGDAAHQMPPFNGQGMTSGLRDAENLSWKLALAANDLGGEALLDTYDAERRPHVVDVVAHSCDAGRLIDAIAAGVDVSPESGYGGGRAFPHLSNGFVSGDHQMVGRQVPAAVVSRDVVDDQLGDGFTLLLPPGKHSNLPGAWPRLDPRVIHLDETTTPSMLVRPDSYVAAVADDLGPALDQLSGLLTS